MIRLAALASACLFAMVHIQSVAGPVEDAQARGLAWLVQTQRGDGSFAGLKGLEVQSTAAAVEAMLAGGMSKSPQYARALSWLANTPGGSLDSRAWQAGVLAAAGRDAKSIAGVIRDERNTLAAQSGAVTGGLATWGAYPGYGASVPDTAMGYGALRNAGVAYTNDTTELTVTALCNILPAQLATTPWTGAWPHALPQSGQPAHASTGSLAASAIMLHELKKQRQANRFLSGTACGKTSPGAIDTAMTSAKTWLIAQANVDGGFAERNAQTGALETSSPVTTAMAVRALALFAAEGDSASGTAIANARNWLAGPGQQNTDGSWRGDPFVTARVLAALPVAAGAQLTDSDQDGLTDVVEQRLGTQTLVADAQSQIKPGANAVPGITATAFSATGLVNQAFSYNLLTSGGNGPYTYKLDNGTLPPGLTLAATGTINGVPTTPGSFAFDYQATDAGGARTLVIGRVDVMAATAADGDVPLPGWALLALGGALLATIRRRAAQPSA
jgi:hypothetical protein